MIRRVAARVAVAACLVVTGVCQAQQEPESFDAAWKQAQKLVEAMQATRASANDLKARLDRETDGTARSDLQKKLDEVDKSVATIKLDLAAKVEVALNKAQPTTAIEDVKRVRYLKCYLKWENGEYAEAADQSEIVAMRYPKSEVALPCAKIALASHMHLYQAKKADAAKAKVLLLANHIVATWPNHADAATARDVLTQLK